MIAGSSGGTKWDSTRVFTPAAAATLPQSSADVWLSMMCCFSVVALGTFATMPIHRRHPQRLVHQHVGALRQRDQVFRHRGVTGNHDRAIGRIEAVRECVLDRRMVDDRRGHLDVVVLQHDTAAGELVRVHQRHRATPGLRRRCAC